jgi:acyl-CoA reductase-like NAD-dependent aldehyde dehydrogenase
VRTALAAAVSAQEVWSHNSPAQRSEALFALAKHVTDEKEVPNTFFAA